MATMSAFLEKIRSITFLNWLSCIDWILVFSVLPLLIAGLLTMNSFGDVNHFFNKQLFLIALSLFIFFLFSTIDFHFLRKTWVLVVIFCINATALAFLLALGVAFKGARSWFDLGLVAFQPSDTAKLVLILVLAKYFSRRHVDIAHFKHILISGMYAFIFFVLVLFQPAFGSAIIIFLIWLGMILVSGVSKKQLAVVVAAGAITFFILWSYVFIGYQKQRILTFVHPLTDIHGAGYNIYQSKIAVGSGQLFGKGVGYGTQSKLRFLPEYQTDFIFAAFAEEWGYFGVLILFGLFGVIIWRILLTASNGATNFETLFGIGLAILIISHFVIHVGVNIGILPVTGLTLPFVSYGGSHLMTEFTGLGILMGMRRYSREIHKNDMSREFLGM